MFRQTSVMAWSIFWTQCLLPCWAQTGFSVQQKSDRLLISLDSGLVAEYVFDDPKILRPYFCNLRLANGLQVTRNHPPIDGVDTMDHAAMHPGVWLGFGDISGQDYWRNKARIRHVQFLDQPEHLDGSLTFATECELQDLDGQPLCRLTNGYRLSAQPTGWLLVWEATFHALSQAIVFGDQEEMGFGARVATPITEKNGGHMTNSSGLQSAQKTWGQAADWCDYSGKIDGKNLGITLMASRSNFRGSWWHNRDYGLVVANPFGRQAMKQGDISQVKLQPGQSLRLRFGVFVHGELDGNWTICGNVFDDFNSQP